MQLYLVDFSGLKAQIQHVAACENHESLAPVFSVVAVIKYEHASKPKAFGRVDDAQLGK